MATVGITITKDSTGFQATAGIGDQVAAVAAAQGAHKTSFETALATLVADGASPTQAHVTSANSAYTTLKTDIGAMNLPSGCAILIYDTANVTNFNDLKNALAAALNAVRGNGTLSGAV